MWVAFNGLIYNHAKLRQDLLARGHRFSTHTDTEVLVHLYEEYGDALVHALEGMFAFAIWDERRAAAAARARPLRREAAVRARVRRRADVRLRADRAARGRSRSCGSSTPLRSTSSSCSATCRAPARSCPASASCLPATCSRGSTRAGARASGAGGRRPREHPRAPSHSMSLAAEVEQLFAEAIRTRLVADVPVGVFLSGGVDSALVAVAAARESSQRLQTFTVGYDVGAVNETEQARRVAHYLDSEHHEVTLTARHVAERAPALLAELDQPLGRPGAAAAARALGVRPPARHSCARRRGRGRAVRRLSPLPLARTERARVGGPPRGDRALARQPHAARARARACCAGGRAARAHAAARAPPRLGDRPTAPRPPILVRAAARGRGRRARVRAAAGARRRARRGEHRTLADEPGPGGLPRRRRAREDRSREHARLAGDPDRVPAPGPRGAGGLGRSGAAPGRRRARRCCARCCPPTFPLLAASGAIARRRSGCPRRRGCADRSLPRWRASSSSGAIYREGYFRADAARCLWREHVAGERDHSAALWPLLSLGLWVDRFLGLDAAPRG